MDITDGDIATLADKLDGLDLTEAEAALLDGLLHGALAEPDMVEGYGRITYDDQVPPPAPEGGFDLYGRVMTHPYFARFKNSDGILFNVHGLPKEN